MRIIVACILALACCMVAPVWADQLKMECQVAQSVGAKEPLGAYAFVFTTSRSLAINMQSSHPPIPLFGHEVAKWNLLFAKGGHAVFYGIVADDLFGPVQVFSLDFEKPNMATYWLGGEFEDAPQYKARCGRLN